MNTKPTLLRFGVAVLVTVVVTIPSCRKAAVSAPTSAEIANVEAMDDLDGAIALLDRNEAAFASLGYDLALNRRSAEAQPADASDAFRKNRKDGAGADVAAAGDLADTAAVGGAVTKVDSDTVVTDIPSEPAAGPQAVSEPEAQRDFSESAPQTSGDARYREEERGPDCETLCALTAATCDLEEKICSMAQRHVGDPRYSNACFRAENDCEQATGIAAATCACEGAP